MDIEGSFIELKWPKRDAGHSAPFSAQVKNVGAIPPLPHKDDFAFYIKAESVSYTKVINCGFYVQHTTADLDVITVGVTSVHRPLKEKQSV